MIAIKRLALSLIAFPLTLLAHSSANAQTIQHANGAGGGTSYTTTVTWPVSFGDTNYSAVCTPVGPSPTSDLYTIEILSKAAGSISVKVDLISGLTRSTLAEIDCVAVHT